MEELVCEDEEKRIRLINFYNELSPIDKQTLAQIYPWLPYKSSRAGNATNTVCINGVGSR